MKFSGKGPTGTKFARWLNKVLVGNLGKLIKGEHGIIVLSTPPGVTITTNAAAHQLFYLTDELNSSFNTRLGRALTKLNVDHYRSSGWATPHEAPATSLPEVDLYFAFSRGWHPKGSVVWAAEIAGRWEVVSQGLPNFRTAMATTGSVTIPGEPVLFFGEQADTEVDVENPFNLTVAADDEVRIAFDDIQQYLYIDAKVCI